MSQGPQHFDLNPDTPQPIQNAVQSGKVTPKQAYEAGYAEIRCNHLQSQFKGSPVYQARHESLNLNLDMVLHNAGISINALCTSATTLCKEREIQALTQWHNHSKGLIYLGNIASVYKRMELVTAALVRNYVDARMTTVDDLIKDFMDGDLQGSVVVVPDFYTQVCENKSHDPFLRAKTNAYTFLIKLKQMKVRAIIYVYSVEDFVSRHGGPLLHDLLREQLIPVEV